MRCSENGRRPCSTRWLRSIYPRRGASRWPDALGASIKWRSSQKEGRARRWTADPDAAGGLSELVRAAFDAGLAPLRWSAALECSAGVLRWQARRRLRFDEAHAASGRVCVGHGGATLQGTLMRSRDEFMRRPPDVVGVLEGQWPRNVLSEERRRGIGQRKTRSEWEADKSLH